MEDAEKRREKAMQAIRPLVFEKLDRLIEEAKEELEDEIIEALVDAGVDEPITDPKSHGADEAIGFVEQCFEEAVHYWHGSRHGPVWAMLSFDNDNGIRGLEVEFFGTRPRTWLYGENWPCWFRVYEGNLDGGDSVIADSKGANFG